MTESAEQTEGFRAEKLEENYHPKERRNIRSFQRPHDACEVEDRSFFWAAFRQLGHVRLFLSVQPPRISLLRFGPSVQICFCGTWRSSRGQGEPWQAALVHILNFIGEAGLAKKGRNNFSMWSQSVDNPWPQTLEHRGQTDTFDVDF